MTMPEGMQMKFDLGRNSAAFCWKSANLIVDYSLIEHNHSRVDF